MSAAGSRSFATGPTAEAPHPLIDAAGDGWAATETREDVIALTPAMSDFLHRVSRERGRPLVVSGEHSRMTQPLREVLDDVGGHWVVRTDAGTFHDARTGALLDRAADVLALGRRPTEGAVAPEFLRSPVSTRLRIVVSFSTRHRVSRTVRLGGPAETLATQLAGEAPVAWGATEPVVAPWSRDELTAYSRRRMPADSRWIAVGAASAPYVATIAVARTAEGVEETTRASADRGPAGDPRHADLAADAAAALRAGATHGMPLLGFAFAYIGAPDLAARAVAEPAPQPLALFIGPPAVRLLSADDADLPRRWAGDFGAEQVGRPRLPGLLVPLGSADGGGWERLGALLRSADADKVTSALGLVPRLAVELARAEERARDGHPTPEGGADA